MKKIKHQISLSICALLAAAACLAGPGDLGQTIQIYTRFNKIYAKPTWLLIVRDLDHGQNIPYLYDFKHKDNFWLAFTYGRNYLITASRLVFNPHSNKKISNFCGLESHGRIIRGQSLYITITGKLSPNTDTYTCSVQRYADSNFSIATPAGTM